MADNLSEKLIDVTIEPRTDTNPSEDSQKSPSNSQTNETNNNDRRGSNLSKQELLCTVEEIILENPVDKQRYGQILFYGNMILLYVWLFGAGFVGIGISFLIMYARSVADVTPSIYVAIGLCCVRGLFELNRVVFSKQNRINHFGNLVDCLNCLGVCLVLLFYFIDIMSNELFVILMVTNVSIQIFIKPFFRTYLFYFLDLLLNLACSVGLLMICLKMAYPSDFASWNIMLLWYTFINYCTTAIGGAAVLIAVLILPLKWLKVGPISHLSYSLHFAIMIFGLFVTCVSFCLFVTYLAIKYMLVNGIVGPRPFEEVTLPFSLILAAYFQIVLGGVVIIAVLFIKIFQRKLISAFFIRVEKKRIIKKTYNHSFKLKLITSDGQHFHIPSDDIHDQPSELQACLICNGHSSTILIRPCNHTVVCSYCLSKLLGGKNECPLCKNLFEKCHSLQFNQEAGCFEVTSTMQLRDCPADEDDM